MIDCGWGRMLFGQTFADPAYLAHAMRSEAAGQRDIAFGLSDPQVVLGLAPQELFLDPSHTYRLQLSTYRPERRPKGFRIRQLRFMHDAHAVNRIYAARSMIGVAPAFMYMNRFRQTLIYYLAENERTGEVIGAVTGVDHVNVFGDPENGSSLWCLAVDPRAGAPGIGESLVRCLAEHFRERGRAFMDLSVLHDNANAIALYEKLGFVRIPLFTVKRRNAINEPLFVGSAPEASLNPYASIIVKEARRRGIGVDVLDPEGGFFRLTLGGRSITCRESLSELTSAVALSRCDDKATTLRILAEAGLAVPAQCRAGSQEENAAFLARHGRVVVKPARGEQGRGITVDIRDAAGLETAIARARGYAETALIEQFVDGQDLRIVVINDRVVAAALRRPAEVTGTGEHTIRQLIDAQSRRRAAATGGESRIPIDEETERCVGIQGWTLDAVLPVGERLFVRKTANLHTGGTLHDVTAQLHPVLASAAVAAARALEIPVVGLDLLVADPAQPDYVIVEANERPGLANHEPQPTAERFIDLLFPQTAS